MIWETLIEAAKNKAGEYIIDFAAKKKNWELVTNFFTKKDKKRKIIILGSSGVGKSQFVQSLQPELPQIAVQKRTMGTVEKEASLQGQGIIFLDTAGQANLKIQIDEFQKTTTDDDYVGIINIVSYGYHYASTLDIEKDIFDGDKVKGSFLESSKERELEDIRRWLPFLEYSKVKWIITLVNKADIWWKEKTEVHQYYESGEYGKTFENHFQKNYFKKEHIILPYTAVIEPFYNRPNAGLLGDTAKNTLQTRFASELTRLIKDKK
ncbi:MAG: hypothetical protein EAZ06_06095 [Cytophagales bacterium]|nr:MAG: hypothetical protein EAY69_07820 [Cytophagales bacterium]TAH29649.1 MAG: hypothetical protein EAZ06_06095 [Cytophagales bacterium]